MTPVDSPDREYGSIAYASASEGALAKAPNVLIAPRSNGPDPNGFEEPTWVFPGLFFPVYATMLPPPLGRLSPEELRAVRAVAPRALGVGDGAALPAHRPGRERGMRGVVTRLSLAIREQRPPLNHVVVVTPYPFSVQRTEFQAIVPIYPGAKNVRSPDFVLPACGWGDALGGEVCVAVSDVMMTKRDNLEAGPPNAYCDADDMALIDDALMAWLGLTLSAVA